MLLVKTYLAPSPIHGIGLFADQFIPRGTQIWEFTNGMDFEISQDEIAKLSPLDQGFVARYGYRNKVTGKHVVCVDDARFFNHSSKPNTDNTDEKYTIANRDIESGEELTCDYFEFDADAEGLLRLQLKP